MWDKFCYIHNLSAIYKLYTRNICVTRTCLTLVLCLKCIHYVFSIMHEYSYACAVEPWTCCSLHCSVIEFIDHCYLELLNPLMVLCYISHCTQIGTLQNVLTVPLLYVTSSLLPNWSTDTFPTPPAHCLHFGNRTSMTLWSRSGTPAQRHKLEDGRICLQLSSKHIDAPMTT